MVFTYFVSCNGPCHPKEKCQRKEHSSSSSSNSSSSSSSSQLTFIVFMRLPSWDSCLRMLSSMDDTLGVGRGGRGSFLRGKGEGGECCFSRLMMSGQKAPRTAAWRCARQTDAADRNNSSRHAPGWVKTNLAPLLG